MRHTKTILTLLLTFPLPGLPALAQQNIITTAIGGGPNDMPAIDADVNQPFELALDSAGNLYIAAGSQNRVFKVSTSGALTVVAGTGLPGYAGDGVSGGAANALLNNPAGVAVDPSGNVYISDNNSCVIRKVDTTSTITTIVGQAGECAYNGNGAPATNFYLYFTAGLAEGSGNLYIADQSNQVIRKLVLATGTISNYAGTPQTAGFSGDAGPATSAALYNPISVVVDPSGNVFVSDTGNYRVRKVAASMGNITTIAGNGTSGYGGDGSPATQASFDLVGQVAVAVNGGSDTVTLVDIQANVVRQFSVGGNIYTIAGNALLGYSFCGDGGSAINACFYNPYGVAVTSSGSLVYVADNGNNRVRMFQPSGNINTIAGNGSASMPTPVSSVPPHGVVLYNPFAAMKDPSGNIFVSDLSNSFVRELVQSTDLVNLFAGTGVQGYNGDGISATAAELNSPAGLARDSFGNVYIADPFNCIVREVSPAGTISTFAGTPQTCGYSGDGGSPAAAKLTYPFNVFVDSHNNVFIADTYNCVVRKASGGTITTYAGDGTCGYVGDGGPPADAELYYPEAVVEDGAGNVYIADTYNNRIRMVSASTGNISTVAGDGNAAFTGDGVATENSVYTPQDVKADVNGNLFIADTYNQRVRWVSPSGYMTMIAGDGTAGYSGDGGPAGNAELYYSIGIFEDASGNLLVADQLNLRVRRISAFAGLGVSSSSLTFGLVTIGSTSPPQALTLSAVGPLTITTVLVTGAFEEADNCPASLTNGQTCAIYVYFKPTASGTQTGTLTIEDNGYFNGTTSIALQGTGSAISITGAPVIFSNQLVKTASTVHSVTVSNKGKTNVIMGAITLVETTDFAISSNTCPASGSALAASATCAVGLPLTRKALGPRKAFC
jgi:DNA-binding beta-propeller fold protein YncE